MAAFLAMVTVAVIPILAQDGADVSWADEVTTEVFDGESIELGWIKAAWCAEGNGPLNKRTDIQSLAASAISVKIVPAGSTSNAQYDSFAVVAKPGSSVVQALNDYKELSFSYDPTASPNRVGWADLNNWIGSTTAKARLSDYCGPNDLRAFDVVYQACGNGGGLHIWYTKCVWQWNNANLGQDIEIYFGYATNPITDEPTVAPTNDPTPFDQNPVIELPWSTDTVQEWTNIWIVGQDEANSGTGTLLNEDDLSFLANNYRVVSLEKCLRDWGGNGETEKFFYNLYNGIKDRNADTKVLYYWNLPAHFADCYNIARYGLTLPEDPYLYDDNGNGPLWSGTDVRFAWDLRKPEVREWNVDYLEAVIMGNPVERTDDGGQIDGLFLDGLCAWPSNYAYENANGEKIRGTFSQQSVVEYNQAIIEYLKLLKQRLPDAYILGNGMFNYWFNEPDSGYMLNADGYCSHAIPYIDGICLEHFGAFEEVDSTTGLINPAIFKEWVNWSTDIVVNDKYGPGKSIFVKAFPGPVTNLNGISATQTAWTETAEVLEAYACGENPTTTDEASQCAADNLDFLLAAYLCGVHNERVYLSYTWWYRHDQGPLPGKHYAAPEEYYPQLLNRLGAALGPAQFSDANEYFCQRDFEFASLSVDLSDPSSAVIVWETQAPTTAEPTTEQLPTTPPTPAPTFNVPEWADEVTTIEYDGNTRDIAWVRVFECTEGTTTFSRSSDYDTLATTAISVKIVPAGGPSNPDYDDFAVVAKPDSNVIVALNDLKELSYTYDPDASPNRIGFANPSNWIGTNTALARVIDGCGPDDLRSGVIYAAQCNNNGLHIWNGMCKWEWANTVGQDIEVYVGFDLDAEV